MTWSVKERTTWYALYVDPKAEGLEYYFDNQNGYKRCLEEAKAGIPRAEKVWAMYVERRMTG
ncbi:hypothetical protein [Herminiimonas sp. CN]|uniref:hypothetical protein n=1 Tax=Herminiimonas sp. CN TaxID=1349818 RepID=UPI000473F9FB|nr:hypothetical protein [Herminiimonas sp. CN]